MMIGADEQNNSDSVMAVGIPGEFCVRAPSMQVDLLCSGKVRELTSACSCCAHGQRFECAVPKPLDGPKMEYRRLPLDCGCGGVPKHISGVGLSSGHQLVIEWRCPRCRRNVGIVKSLSDCWRDCSTEASPDLPNYSTMPLDAPDDRTFLRRLGITYSDE